MTRTFLLAWYTTMMSRVENAGRVVTKGFTGVNMKGDKSPVTDADMASHAILTQGSFMTPIVSEESPERSADDIITWVDPLDATKEYTEGLTHYVSIMACLTNEGKPVAGIVHFPFTNETWAAIGNEWVRRPEGFEDTSPPSNVPDNVFVSRSHAGSVRKAVPGYKVVPSGGAGFKTAQVLKGNALAYVHVTKIKAWDLCAADALMRASNGSFVGWRTGLPYRYTQVLANDGVYASFRSLPRFKASLWLHSRWLQLALMLCVWAGIYLFPGNRVKPPQPALPPAAPEKLSFASCVAGLLCSYLVWGLAQERLMSWAYVSVDSAAATGAAAAAAATATGGSGGAATAAVAAGGERFMYPAVLIFFSRCGSFLFAGRLMKARSTPLWQFSYSSVANVVASVCQYSALQVLPAAAAAAAAATTTATYNTHTYPHVTHTHTLPHTHCHTHTATHACR